MTHRSSAVTVLLLAALFAACDSATETLTVVQLGPFASMANAIDAPGYYDPYNHIVGPDGTALVRRISYHDWRPIGEATITAYPIQSTTPNPETGATWQGVPGVPPTVYRLSLAETRRLFSAEGLPFPGNFAYRVDVLVARGDQRAEGYDWFCVKSAE